MTADVPSPKADRSGILLVASTASTVLVVFSGLVHNSALKALGRTGSEL
jgi:hypothetical protein